MPIIERTITLLIVLCIAVAPAAMAQESYFDPDTGLRVHHYTDPVPNYVPGGTVLDTAGVKDLINSGRVALIDVLSISGVRYDELDGSWSDYKPRYNIPVVSGCQMWLWQAIARYVEVLPRRDKCDKW